MILRGAPTAILVEGPRPPAVAALCRGLGIPVVDDVAALLTCQPPTVAILTRPQPPVPGCHAWYVGEGAAPAWTHAVLPQRGDPVELTVRLLGLLGTSLAQERAGAAFRAASAGVSAPRSAPFATAEILDGITRAVTRRGADATGDALLRSSFEVLDRCCGVSGAIAAAPRSDIGPDYWFAWQRDGAHAAYALHLLALHGPDEDLRRAAAGRRDGWVRFVDGTAGNQLAASRRSMTGTVVGGYGNPQQDGPAATALVLLTVVAGGAAALAAARPWLDYLLSPAAGEPGYDLWELTFGHSFHAANLRRRALVRGARLAAEAGDDQAGVYTRAAGIAEQGLAAFRAPTRRGLLSVLKPQPQWFELVSRLDMGVVGSAMLAYDPRDDAGDRYAADIQDTLQLLRAQGAARGGRGIGRFPEDCNDGSGSTGGNPWVVTTLWAAQQLFRGGDTLPALGYLLDVLAGDPHALGEQLDGATGVPRGVAPLAWSHAELVVTLADPSLHQGWRGAS